METKNHLRGNPYWLVAISLFLIPLSGLSIDINVPSLPALTHYFQVDKSFAQLTITIYILGYGISQLLSGSLADSLGRKSLCILALSAFITTTLLAALSTHIYQLLGWRLLQGIAIGFANPPIRAVVPDLFTGRKFQTMTTYQTMAWSVGPIIAPAIGGYLQQYFGWQAPFYFLIIYAVTGLLFYIFYMPETLLKKQAYSLKGTVSNYRLMLTNMNYLIGLFCLGLVYSVQVLFAVVAPFLVQSVLHYSPSKFGHMALLMGLAWFLGNLSNRLLINFTSRSLVLLCFSMMLVVSIIMLFVAITLPIKIYNIIIPVFIILYFGGLALPAIYSRLLALFPLMVASAGALISSSSQFIASLSSGLSTLLKSNTQVPFAAANVVLLAICLASYYYGHNNYQPKNVNPNETAP